MKYAITSIMLCLVTLSTTAQDFLISGKIADEQTKETIMAASIRLLQTDSSFVTGAQSNMSGAFSLNAKKAGRYLVAVSYIGYHTLYKAVTLTAEQPQTDLGTLLLNTNDVALKEAEVTAAVARVEQLQDTTVFNAAAYRVPEGSTLEALIQQLPGVEVEEDGTIKWNGKTVTEFLTNSKDFFKGNTNIAMKNLPSTLVSKVKAYDRKSDYTLQTGIDDGEETTVLDLTLKRELNETWFSSLDVGVGSKGRYNEKLFLNYFNDRARITAFASLNNVNDRSFSGFGGGFGRRGGGGGTSSGLTALKTAGADFVWDNGKKRFEAGRVEIGGNARFSFSDNDLVSLTNAERFLTSGASSSFTNRRSISATRSTAFDTEWHLDWSPDSLTSISFRPGFSHSHGNTNSLSKTATFNSDASAVSDDPLEEIFSGTPSTALTDIAVNTNQGRSLGTSLSNSANANLNIVRRLGASGRNVSFRGSVGYTHSFSKTYSISDIRYWQTTLAGNSTFSHQYNYVPQESWNYSAQLGYTEPLSKSLSAEVRYRYTYRYSDSDRSLYDLDTLYAYGRGTNWFGHLPSEADSMALAFNAKNSRYATYRYYNHNIVATLNYNKNDLFIQVGAEMQPQRSEMAYQTGAIDTVITRHVFNISPRVRVRYRMSKTTNLMVFYNGSASQPSMTNLLDITDDSDPLNITQGNPGLKPSWTNRFNANFNSYNANTQQGFMANLRFSQTSNAVSNAVTYDETTGVSVTRPENINGNWNANLDLSFNTPLNRSKLLTLGTSTSSGYTQAVGYVRVNGGSSEKSATRTFNIYEKLNLNYRLSAFDIGAFGSIDYRHSRNKLQTSANLDTYGFTYGMSTNVTLPWDMTINTDLGMSSRRGYTDASMNTDEFIWNAQIAQTFLKNKAATLSIKFYDLLHQQSNVSRVLNAQMRSDSWTNAINSYFMVSFTYRLNLIGGAGGSKQAPERGRRGGYGGGEMPMGGMF